MATSGLTAQLRVSTEEELLAKLAEAKEELFNLRFQGATGQLESHARLRAGRNGRGQAAAAETHGTAAARGSRKGREGLVVSDKMDKTVVVQVEAHVKPP